MIDRIKANSGSWLGTTALVVGIVAVIAYCIVDDTVGWWGLLFVLPLLPIMAMAASASHR